jgi:hypothetical protein
VIGKKTVARAILLTVVPVIVGTCSDPYANRDLPETWLRGAAICCIAGATAWAAKALDPSSEETR